MRNAKSVAVKPVFSLMLASFLLSLFYLQVYIVKEQTQVAQVALYKFGPSLGFEYAVNCKNNSYCVSSSTIKTRIKIWNDITYPETLAAMRLLIKDYPEQDSYQRGVVCVEGLASNVCMKGSKLNRLRAWKELKK